MKKLITTIISAVFSICVFLPCSSLACKTSGTIDAIFDQCADCSYTTTEATGFSPDGSPYSYPVDTETCPTKNGKGFVVGAGSYCKDGDTGTQTCGTMLQSSGYYFTCNAQFDSKAFWECIASIGGTISAAGLAAATDSMTAFFSWLGVSSTGVGAIAFTCSPCDIWPCVENTGDPKYVTVIDPTKTQGKCPPPA